MSSVRVTEGRVDFAITNAGKPCQTWYKVFGDLDSGTTPLIVVHGGPGAPHNITLALSDLTTTHGIPTIFYDQVGTGLSTHLPEKKGDAEFWAVQLFLAELENLIRHLGVGGQYDLYGHSWGGMLAAEHAIRLPKGLRRLVLAGTPAASALWTAAQWALRADLPQGLQEVLKKHEDAGSTNSKEYNEAMDVFYARHLCRLDPMPDDVLAGVASVKEDSTVFMTMNGPSEFYHQGSLKDWSIVSNIHKIAVPTLLTNGRFDQAQDDVMEPFFRGIANVKWTRFLESGHMPHVEEREKYMKFVGDFLDLDLM